MVGIEWSGGDREVRVFFESWLKPFKSLDYPERESLGFASLFSWISFHLIWISFPLALISFRVDLDFLA